VLHIEGITERPSQGFVGLDHLQYGRHFLTPYVASKLTKSWDTSMDFIVVGDPELR
jgi:hypothetical protein